MTNKRCKCGHEEEQHVANGKHGKCNSMKCPCKKFEPKMIGILEMAKRIKDEDRELAKNHSPSEGKIAFIDNNSETYTGLSKNSGGDSPLTNPEPDSVSRIDGGDSQSNGENFKGTGFDTLSSKIYDADEIYSGDIPVEDIKDFIQKLRGDMKIIRSRILREFVEKKINERAGPELT